MVGMGCLFLVVMIAFVLVTAVFGLPHPF